MGGNENDGNVVIGIGQPPLQLDAAHPRQAHIEDQARRMSPVGGIEEFFGRGEGICQKASGLQDAPQRLTKGCIVVNDGDGTRLVLNVIQLNSSRLLLDEMSREQAQATIRKLRKLSCFRRRSVLTFEGRS